MHNRILVLVRHGQSQWNLENKFTGDVDVELTDHGRDEALLTAKKLKTITFDIAFTSELKRAQETLSIILKEINETQIPIEKNAALNERNYGDLQGLNKTDIAEKYGIEQVALWRRSYDVAPPHGESLQMTQKRVMAYYNESIVPHLKAGNNVLVVAHGNSLRSLVMALESISETAISEVNIPTGAPRFYHFDEQMNLIHSDYLTQSF
ncbi:MULTISPECIES: 2,3-diphosphoglycerate-dependent phosphoglycerate mutase [unclassified Siphonobacter]|uniref:2,3-bisphosphoglycerate-dependent phosphoglycerate mutase n=1 Tax=unclassified Siphonobacter TaxID=2635712 RepID=UPI00278923E6|nr:MULTISPECIES: 2,3-bisphosphoglycerate-dependent phosphoglycerate mutase [unclassified Siphonobacter]MDQ1088797.1 2,3-bisphosphoglycerate-dependent phosphoglycerate mutase [Siphonobacter sp. SORGH_AS_1065]MDR6194981.1 2,3-bisphosphoglycerate-dependent phosphoglycerate mutase [Siphonobacter sp. SORGH_AS_0500]